MVSIGKFILFLVTLPLLLPVLVISLGLMLVAVGVVGLLCVAAAGIVLLGLVYVATASGITYW